MLNNSLSSPAAAPCGPGTSAYETGLQKILSFNSNTLRYYNPAGRRRRKKADTAEILAEMKALIIATHPDAKRVKLTNTGICFKGRVHLRNGRIALATAYSVRGLYLRLEYCIASRMADS